MKATGHTARNREEKQSSGTEPATESLAPSTKPPGTWHEQTPPIPGAEWHWQALGKLGAGTIQRCDVRLSSLFHA